MRFAHAPQGFNVIFTFCNDNNRHPRRAGLQVLMTRPRTITYAVDQIRVPRGSLAGKNPAEARSGQWTDGLKTFDHTRHDLYQALFIRIYRQTIAKLECRSIAQVPKRLCQPSQGRVVAYENE